MKILVAEDDHFLVNAYKVKLSKSGFDVVIAQDGAEALEKLASEKPDALILDLIMPGMDGFVVLEKMKQDTQLAKIPVIVASNLGQDEDIKKAIALGAKHFIVKSNFKIDDLVELLHTLQTE